jgi:1-acyl-sn-glycerol-3-phosphate acyltransferase
MGTQDGWFVKALRALLSVFIRAAMLAVYRIRVRGSEQLLPGGALLICNHLSHADALWIGTAIRRPIVFLMHRSFFSVPVIGSVARLFGTIPVASQDSDEEKRRSLELAIERARCGELVCIFPEGAISRTGQLLGFRRGMETIAREAGVPIQPIVLDRVWGSIFSFRSGRFFFKRPRRWPYPLDLVIGAPLKASTPAWVAHDALAALQAQARHLHYAGSLSLAERLRRRRRQGCEALVMRFSQPVLEFGPHRFAPHALLAAAQALMQVFALDERGRIWLGCELERCPAVVLAALLSQAELEFAAQPSATARVWIFEADRLEAASATGLRAELMLCIATQRGRGREGLLWACAAASLGGIAACEVPQAGHEQGAREGSLGRALPGTALSVRDECGVALEPGQRGELQALSAFSSQAQPGLPLAWESLGLAARVDRDGFVFVDAG